MSYTDFRNKINEIRSIRTLNALENISTNHQFGVSGEYLTQKVVVDFDVNKLSDTDYINDIVNNAAFGEFITNRYITHINLVPDPNDNTKIVEMQSYAMYLKLDNINPMINGDLLLQGHCYMNYGPVLCILEYENTNEEGTVTNEIITIPPWQMMITSVSASDSTSDNNNDNGNENDEMKNTEDMLVEKDITDSNSNSTDMVFTIPISLGSQTITSNKIIVKIYATVRDSIPYENEDTSYELNTNNDNFILTTQFETDVLINSDSHDDDDDDDDDDVEDEDDEVNRIQNDEEKLDALDTIENNIQLDESGNILLNPDNPIVTGNEDNNDLGNTNDTAKMISTKNDHLVEVVTDLKVVTNPEDVNSYKEEGYQLYTTRVSNDGYDYDNESIWPFYILTKTEYIDMTTDQAYSGLNSMKDSTNISITGEDGNNSHTTTSHTHTHTHTHTQNTITSTTTTTQYIQDIIWYTCDKSIGLSSNMMNGYTIFDDDDVSHQEAENSIYIGVKYGPHPKYSKIILLSTDYENEDDMKQYIEMVQGSYISCPNEICKLLHGYAGILLTPIQTHNNNQDETWNTLENNLDQLLLGENIHPDMTSAIGMLNAEENSDNVISDTSVANSDSVTKRMVGGGGQRKVMMSNKLIIPENEYITTLQDKVATLQLQKSNVLQQHQQLEKRCIELLHKETEIKMNRRMSVTTYSAMVTGSLEASTANGGDGATGVGGGGGLQEREELYRQIVATIKEKQSKYTKQRSDYDQLAMDLQVRLDDKSMKLKEESMKYEQIKLRALSHSINSKTGKKYTIQEINDLHDQENKKYEILEKIRIKHLSLLSIIKKHEKIIQQKEQLADGLHVIDFEQLKIENQSLHEKIQERCEDSMKLKRKRMSSIQILTHLREKQYYQDIQNSMKRQALQILEDRIIRLRALISSTRLNMTTTTNNTTTTSAVTPSTHTMKHTMNTGNIGNTAAMMTSSTQINNNDTALDLEIQNKLASNTQLLLDYEQRFVLNDRLQEELDKIKIRYKTLSKSIQQTTQQKKAEISKRFYNNNYGNTGGGNNNSNMDSSIQMGVYGINSSGIDPYSSVMFGAFQPRVTAKPMLLQKKKQHHK